MKTIDEILDEWYPTIPDEEHNGLYARDKVKLIAQEFADQFPQPAVSSSFISKFQEIIYSDLSDSEIVNALHKLDNDGKPHVKGSASRRPWNCGKRKPVTDDCGNKWCDCKEPKLISGDGRGQAFCLLCITPWYH